MRRKHQIRERCIVCDHVYDEEHERIPGRYPCRKCYREQQKKYSHTLVQQKESRDRLRAYNHCQVKAFKALWKSKEGRMGTSIFERLTELCDTVCATSDQAYNNLNQRQRELLKQWEEQYL